uniref:RNA-dependent RNA polymerase n=1 Tax=Vovk virus TaxID=2707280 RepID=A0A859D175_9VIRU|nr:RNA-dependent RNA polymerase [Vovk virus]
MPELTSYLRDGGADLRSLPVQQVCSEHYGLATKQAHRCRYRIPTQHVPWFNDLVRDADWLNGREEHPHAAAASARHYVRRKVLALATEPYVEFGGKPEHNWLVKPDFDRCPHICSANFPRDVARYRQAAMTLKKIEDPRVRHVVTNLEAAASGLPLPAPTTHMCFQGGENCTHRPNAAIAIAVDATYDVLPETFVKFMQNKSLHTAYVAMMFPPNLFHDATLPDDVFTYYWAESAGEQVLVQGFSGSVSEPYVHSLRIWRSWVSTTVVTGPNADYQFVSEGRYGLYRIIRITRVPHAIIHTPDVEFDFNGFCFIPDFSKLVLAFATGKCNKDLINYCLHEVPYLAVPYRMVAEVVDYVVEKNTADYPQVLAYYRSRCQSLRFAGVALQQKWERLGLPEVEFISVYICALVSRFKFKEALSIAHEKLTEFTAHGLVIDIRDHNRYAPRGRFRRGLTGWIGQISSSLHGAMTHFFECVLGRPFSKRLSELCFNDLGIMVMRPIRGIRIPARRAVIHSWDQPRLMRLPRGDLVVGHLGSVVDDFRADYLATLATEGEFADLMARVKDLDIRAPLPRHPNAVLRVGPPGAGKTTTLMRAHKSCLLYIAPSKAIGAQVADRAKSSGCRWRVLTQHTALLEPAIHDVVVLDEVFTYHAGYVQLLLSQHPEARFYFLGDYNQCDYYDEGVPNHEQFGFRVIAARFTLETTRENYRTPVAVAEKLRRIPGYDVLHKSSKTGSFAVESYATRDRARFAAHRAVLTLDRSTKELLLTNNPTLNCLTVREAQGSTFDDVGIVITNTPVSPSATRMYYVALTRCTGSTVVYINRDTNAAQLDLASKQLDTCLEVWTGFVPYSERLDEEAPLRAQLVRRPMSHSDTVWEEGEVVAALDAAFGRADVPDDVVAVAPTNVIWTATKFFSLATGKLSPMDVRLRGWAYRGRRHVKAFHAKSHMQTVCTMVARQGARVGFVPKEVQPMADALVEDMTDAFERRYVRTVGGRPAWVPIDVNNLMRELLLYLAKCQDLGSDVKLEPLDVTSFDHTRVQAELKRIYKIVPLGPASEKAGQMISAWSKPLNFIFSMIMRSAERALVDSLNDVTHYANKLTEQDLGDKYAAACLKSPRSAAQELNMDFSQFDASQSRATVALERAVLAKLGVEGPLMDMYFAIRCSWAARAGGLLAIDAESMKSSGEPATLFLNTVLNMAYCAYITKADVVRFQAFKGDDSCIKADVVSLVSTRREVLESLTRVTIKSELSRGAVSHFCGGFLSPRGYFLDYARTAAKIRGIVYRDKEHYEEFQQAVRDRLLTSVAVPADYIAAATEDYYGIDRRTKTNTLPSLMGFVNAFPKWDWSEFQQHAVLCDATTAAATILCADVAAEFTMLPPYDVQRIRAAYAAFDSPELPACARCAVDQHMLNVPCVNREGLLRRRCLICQSGTSSHLCARCDRTYSPGCVLPCSREGCASAAVFAEKFENLCFLHFRNRYKHKSESGNSYRASRPVTPVQQVPPAPAPPPAVERPTGVVSLLDLSSNSDSTSSSGRRRRRLERHPLECGRRMLVNQLGSDVAARAWEMILQARTARGDAGAYVADNDITDALETVGVEYVVGVVDPKEPENLLVSRASAKAHERPVVRVEFVGEDPNRGHYRARPLCKTFITTFLPKEHPLRIAYPTASEHINPQAWALPPKPPESTASLSSLDGSAIYQSDSASSRDP